jgi:hypothetical protein
MCNVLFPPIERIRFRLRFEMHPLV